MENETSNACGTNHLWEDVIAICKQCGKVKAEERKIIVKMGGGTDYNDAELPEGVIGSMLCVKCQGPMTHIGRNLHVCFTCRTIGTEMPFSKPREHIRVVEAPEPAKAPPSIPSSINIASQQGISKEVCTAASHSWSIPETKPITVQQTSVTCAVCDLTLSTLVQGEPQEIMADLLRQIPHEE